MRKSCQYCGRVHPREYICPKKPPRVWRKNRQQKEKFRSTAAWQRMRQSIAVRDGFLCQVCLAAGIYNGDIEVHHIVPLAVDYGRRLDRTNLICLCPAHHKQADAGDIPADRLADMAERMEKDECRDT